MLHSLAFLLCSVVSTDTLGWITLSWQNSSHSHFVVLKAINQDGRNTFHDWNGRVKILLLGRFIWGKPMNVKNYWSVMCQVWSYLDLNIVQFQDRIYRLFFLEEDSRKKPLERCPSCFDNYLFIIKPWDPAIEALGFDFEPLLTACPFTFHISHLP